MVRFRTEGLEELIADMDRMGQTFGPLAESILVAGAEEIKQAWKQAAIIHRLKSTGEMIDSIWYSKKPKNLYGILSIEIYPRGFSRETITKGKRYTRKKMVRNAEKAFVLHYGSSRLPPTHWVDTADNIAGPRVEKVALEKYDAWLKQNGFVK